MQGPDSHTHLPTLCATLTDARKARRWSQLELSMRVGVSQRHISFVESGRARPSRHLLIAWLQELRAPLVVCNAAMLQAGYAPTYSAAQPGDPVLAQATEAMTRLIRSHDPMPALVLDADWNLLQANKGGQWLAGMLTGTLTGNLVSPTGKVPNLLDSLVHPDGFTRHLVNLPEVGPLLLVRLRDEASVRPSLTPRVDAFADLLTARLGGKRLRAASSPAAPMLTARFSSPYGELAFFSMFTTFGTPRDITLASLRVEHMFPADEATREVVHAHVK